VIVLSSRLLGRPLCSEGGSEALEAYLNPKFVSQAGLKD
jgi:hypothetical protein